ncbi:MAG: hypothetical protein GF398_15575 [Chitinivibrionales bacterium]|nr:hypothetical protein [Chitinivibrionales bacterium]
MKLAPEITLVPILHGNVYFSGHVRTLCTNTQFDCVAVDLPEPFEEKLRSAVDRLPFISAVYAHAFEEPWYYIPTDPSDAAIEGIRQTIHNRIPARCIGYPQLRKPTTYGGFPDSHAIEKLGLDAYVSLCLRIIGNPAKNSPEDAAGAFIARKLHDLRADFDSILALVHVKHIARTILHYANAAYLNRQLPAPPQYFVDSNFINPDHLYFALGELPFVTGKLEKERQDPFAPRTEVITTIKELFQETRDEYLEDQESIIELSPARIQVALKFIRNLTLLDQRMIPDLFDIVAAAKGVGGNAYALKILKSAKYYPFLPFTLDDPLMSLGIDRLTTPLDDTTHEAINLLRDTPLVWKTLSIKPDPTQLQKKKYRYRWNPMGMCSHVPEDRTIESFNTYLRQKAKRTMCEDMTNAEKFTASVKDGIDFRETLRNWHTGDIYVKEIPPSRGDLDTVIIIFDAEHDERYPHCSTWYAEHNQESTLSFFASDPFENMIGPGVARAYYGGISLLFPPRHIPNTFEVTDRMHLRNLTERLTYGAMLFSRERNVAYIAAKRPGARLNLLASRLKKHLVWIPLNSFSSETLRKLRRFHILNGKIVRSWAGHFIGD